MQAVGDESGTCSDGSLPGTTSAPSTTPSTTTPTTATTAPITATTAPTNPTTATTSAVEGDFVSV